MFKKILMICVLGMAVASVSACANTADGFGRDMENAGKNIQKTVN